MSKPNAQEELGEYVEELGEHIAEFGDNVRAFLKLESAGGLLLMGATILAMFVKNSPFAGLYSAFLMIPGEVRVGALAIEKPLFLWVNDGLMAVFFFLVVMEIKREAFEGYLSDRAQIILPGIAALGGMAVPALIYLAFNWGDGAAVQGWAVPTATDIAFALAVLSLLGARVPVALKVFLMTLAILDDLGAIVVIAVFYTSSLSLTSLALAAAAVSALVILSRFRVATIGPYVVIGIVLWVCVLKSGVHATLAGVVTALAIPVLGETPDSEPPLRRLIHKLHPWVAFGILPLFAFVNTGVSMAGLDPQLLLGSVPVGIAAGLFLGKQLGVFGFTWLAVSLGVARKPPGVTWPQLYGVSLLCGIGFTMSLFMGGLAFAEGGAGYARPDRLGILIGSFLSGVLGYLVLRFVSANPASQTAVESTVPGA
jgi:NhaA family Na+:H+ antiporter